MAIDCKYPKSELSELADPILQPSHYKSISGPLRDAWEALRARDSVYAAEAVRAMTGDLVERFSLSGARVSLPASVRALYPRELDRIRNQIDSTEANFWNFDNDPFAKDFAFLTHRFIPVGAEFVVPNSIVPREILRFGISAAWLMLARARGFRPFFGLHAHPLSLKDFNPDGWNQTYLRLAELLVDNPRVKGITSSSWFLDPGLRNISPRLTYLRDVPEAGGSRFFLSSIDSKGESGALARSPTRRALFAEGHYIPQIWLRVWLRSDVIRWGKQFRHGLGVAK